MLFGPPRACLASVRILQRSSGLFRVQFRPGKRRRRDQHWKSLQRVWATGYLWVLGYDIGASTLALVVAWVYLKFDGSDASSKLAFLAVFAPLIAAKHVYAKLNTLQHLYDELDGAYEKLELNVREQLEMMVKSIEARDPYTSGHSRRVAALSKAIATDLGLEAKPRG